MCGIVGIVSNRDITSDLLKALQRLEYRGYDSAGIATIYNGEIECRKIKGKIADLMQKVEKEPIYGNVGIAHTRWATSGEPNEVNAHPQCSELVAVIHNGIIENYADLKVELSAKGYDFKSETDTETITALITLNLQEGKTPVEAVSSSLKRLKGSFAIEVLFKGFEDMIIGARRSSPLAIGYGEGEMFIGSDALALSPFTNRVSYLEDGDLVILSASSVKIFNEEGKEVKRDIVTSAFSGEVTGKNNFPHFMLKEIYEQPKVIEDTAKAFFDTKTKMMSLSDSDFDFSNFSEIIIIACGTSLHAAMVAKYWLEKIAKIHVEVDSASEFRYREPILNKNTLAVFVSQSGETADTLAALRYCKQESLKTVGIVNVPESTIAREADFFVKTLAGPEISVASTKAFTTQLALFACFTLVVAKSRKALPDEELQSLASAILSLPAKISDFLESSAYIKDIANNLVVDSVNALYMGRGTSFPIALEGALKLKEVSYIHAEGYSAGEMKHGPIALVDQKLPIVVVAPYDKHFEKTLSNTQEIVARSGKVIFLSNKKGNEYASKYASATITMPEIDNFIAPILYAVPLQLLAYNTALIKGIDMDQPKNLAKSVTVE